MRWHQLIPAWLARLQSDPALEALLGENGIYAAPTGRAVRVPSVEWIMPGPDRDSENFNVFAVQVDIFCRGDVKAKDIEQRIRVLTHSFVGQEMAGERVWAQFTDALTVNFPSDPGVIHRVLVFTFEAARAR